MENEHDKLVRHLKRKDVKDVIAIIKKKQPIDSLTHLYSILKLYGWTIEEFMNAAHGNSYEVGFIRGLLEEIESRTIFGDFDNE